MLVDIQALLNCLAHDAKIAAWVVVDNGSSDEIRDAVQSMGGIYVRPGKNLGFGGGHNLALKQLADVDAPYHLILNPDIVFDEDVLGRLADVMDSHPDVGLVMPKILYPDGSHQYLCKLLPAPIDLVLRRFLPGPWKGLARRRTAFYELRFLDTNTPAYVPSLSGCFMFARRSVLEEVGGFDERFFLYMEDVDLCRTSGVSRLLYWPRYRRARPSDGLISEPQASALTYALRNPVFQQMGWIRDNTRKQINRETLASRGQVPTVTNGGRE